MKVLIVSPGKTHDRTVLEAITEYEKRLTKKLSLEWSLPGASSKEDEAKTILKTIKAGDFVVLLDERGRTLDTRGLATLLDKHLQAGTKRLVFVIGGAFGVDQSVADRADLTLQLSALTFPHMLVRLILAEQLYRAGSVLDGGKYHHA